MKRIEIRDKLGEISPWDIDGSDLDKKLSDFYSLPEDASKYKRIYLDYTSDYDDSYSFHVIGIRDESDEEFDARREQEKLRKEKEAEKKQKARERTEAEERALLAKLQAKYPS